MVFKRLVGFELSRYSDPMFQRIPVREEPSGRTFTIRVRPKLSFMLALGSETSVVENILKF